MKISVSHVVKLTPNEQAGLEERLKGAGMWVPDTMTIVDALYFKS
jgi:hypothetical protein